MTDLIGEIMSYEAGRMSRKEVHQLYQRLINMGVVWTMNPCYGRMARILIERGDCHPKPEE